MTDSEPNSNEIQQPPNLVELYKQRQELIQDLVDYGFGRPIYNIDNQRTRMSMNHQPGENTFDISERNIGDKTLIGVALMTPTEGEYFILGSDLSQLVIRANTDNGFNTTEDLKKIFGPEADGMKVNGRNDQSLLHILQDSVVGSHYGNVTSSQEDPSVLSKLPEAIEFATKKAEELFKKRVENASATNTALIALMNRIKGVPPSSPEPQ